MNGRGSVRFGVRDALDERDIAGCLEIYAPYVRDTAVSFEEHVPTVAEFAQRVRETTATHPWLVLEESEQIVGFAYGSRHRARAAYRWAADVTVYVASTHHHLGAGSLLYRELMRRLRLQGYQVACAGITLPNEASIGLHRALGFEPVGVYRRIGFKHGAWHDVSWWQLRAGASGYTAGAAQPVLAARRLSTKSRGGLSCLRSQARLAPLGRKHAQRVHARGVCAQFAHHLRGVGGELFGAWQWNAVAHRH